MEGGMGSGGRGKGVAGASRVPTWRERENNRRRERRRRAIAAKIFSGLRTYGNYALPKHCDNNEVLKALCDEAGWAVEPDGTTYRKGCKPPPAALRIDPIGRSGSPSPCSSRQLSPRASFNPSLASPSFPSSGVSSHITLGSGSSGYFGAGVEGSSLIPWLKNLSSASAFGASSSKYPAYNHAYFNGGSISAPVTPPSGSPPRRMTAWEYDYPAGAQVQPPWVGAGGHAYASLPSSTPPSPGGRIGRPDPAWLSGLQISSAGPSSPTRLWEGANPFGASSSRMCAPGQSGTCSPVVGCASPAIGSADIQMIDRAAPAGIAFGSGGGQVQGMVMAWEGERIHEEEGASDDLELRLGSSKPAGLP